MAGVGSAALVVALLTALYAVGASIFGARTGRREWVVSGRRAIYCVAGLCVLAFAILESAFLRSDFSFRLVAEGSSTDTPTFYKVTALWATQDGSLLLWATLLGLFASAVLFLTRRSLRDIAPWATAVLGAVAAFFLFLMVGWENPFTTLAQPPAEGAGLNPLLRHPAMMIHPPMLYTGYVGFSIPFAFAIGALITRHTGADWIRSTRRFALVAWTFLGTGILLGALWSYSELGWGGYWAWDPVENASLMPWLVGTAFLHSIMVQEKRGMLKVWNVSLICATFVLALLGTFLVRSRDPRLDPRLRRVDDRRASSSSSSRSSSACRAALILAPSHDLRSEARIDSLLSREAFFLLNNLVLVGLCVVIFWGTFFPLISEAVTGEEASVGPPWFDRLTTPARAGAGPALGHRAGAGVAPGHALGAATPAAHPRPDPRRGAGGAARVHQRRRQPGLAAHVLLRRVRADGGGAGVRARSRGTPHDDRASPGRGRSRSSSGATADATAATSSTPGSRSCSSASRRRRPSIDQQRRAPLARRVVPGGGYEITYVRPTAELGRRRPSGTGAPISFGAVLDVRKGDESTTLHPSRNFYSSGDPSTGTISRFFEGEATSEVDVRWGLRRDFWLAVRPDIASLEQPIREADAKFADAPARRAGT